MGHRAARFGARYRPTAIRRKAHRFPLNYEPRTRRLLCR